MRRSPRSLHRILRTVLFVSILAGAMHGQDPLPPDADAILNPAPSGAAGSGTDGSIPPLDSLTTLDSPPPISIQPSTPQVPLSELAGLPPTEPEESGTPEQETAESPGTTGPNAIVTSPSPALSETETPAPGPPEESAIPSPLPARDVAAGLVVVWLLPLGFALFSAGSGRAKSVGHTLSIATAGSLISIVGYFACGFAFHMGGVNGPQSAAPLYEPSALTQMIGIEANGRFRALAGCSGFGLAGVLPDDHVLFLVGAATCACVVTILSGAVAERMKFSAFAVLSFFVGSLILPVHAAWSAGGGWLAALGDAGPGTGFVDGGSAMTLSVTAGAVAFAALLVLGPRYGKYNRDGSTNPIPGHNLTFVLFSIPPILCGWFGLLTSSGRITGGALAPAFTSLVLGACCGALGAMSVSWLLLKKAEPFLMASGTVAGIVSGAAVSPAATPWLAAVAALISGILAIFLLFVIERRLKIDDPAGALTIHGFAGALGTLGVALLAERGITSPTLLSQAIALLAGAIMVVVASFLVLWVIKMAIGVRVELRDEVAGLDLPELGALGYQPDLNPEPRGPKRS